MVVPSASSIGPVTRQQRTQEPTGSNEITPSTVPPNSCCHIAVAIFAVDGKSGVIVMLVT